MKGFFNRGMALLIIVSVLSGSGILALSSLDTDISVSSFLLLLSGFALYCLIIVALFEIGSVRRPDKTALFSLLSVGLKFIFPLVLALLWFLVAKKSSTAGLIIFFILYLAFTLFLTRVMVKTLKERSI